jgi:hypothetical protein
LNPTTDELLANALGSGEPIDAVASRYGLDARGVFTALGRLALGPEDSDGPPLVRAAPGRTAIRAALEERSLSRLLRDASRTRRLILSAGLLQIFDFWDASHSAAQEADDLGDPSRDAAFWHGIAHRREPDPGNAAYWFRRVGRHGLLPRLAETARPLIEVAGSPPWAERVVRGGVWDPLAFLDVCAASRPGSAPERLARRLQRLEMRTLLEDSIDACLR